MDLIPTGFGLADQVYPSAAGGVVSTAKLTRRLRYSAVRFRTVLPAARAAADGFRGFKSRPIESGSSSRSHPSKSTNIGSVDFPEPLGPAITVSVGTLP